MLTTSPTHSNAGQGHLSSRLQMKTLTDTGTSPYFSNLMADLNDDSRLTEALSTPELVLQRKVLIVTDILSSNPSGPSSQFLVNANRPEIIFRPTIIHAYQSLSKPPKWYHTGQFCTQP